MPITADQIQRCGISATTAALYAEPLSIALDRFDITTPARIAAFLAQCVVESQSFTHTDEVLFYTHADRLASVYPSHFASAAAAEPYLRNPAKLANCVYAGRNGNGDEASGDGFRYRGRGLFQLTGRDNYADAANGLAHDYIGSPDLVAMPADACLTAGWYWHTNKLNALADADAFDAITRAINGRAMLEADRRRRLSSDFKVVLS